MPYCRVMAIQQCRNVSVAVFFFVLFSTCFWPFLYLLKLVLTNLNFGPKSVGTIPLKKSPNPLLKLPQCCCVSITVINLPYKCGCHKMNLLQGSFDLHAQHFPSVAFINQDFLSVPDSGTCFSFILPSVLQPPVFIRTTGELHSW